MAKENRIQDNEVLLRSNTREFREKVLLYGNKMVGKKITYASFEKWLKKTNTYLYGKHDNWKAIYMSILKHQFDVTVAYEKDINGLLVTVLQLNKKT